MRRAFLAILFALLYVLCSLALPASALVEVN